MNQNELKKQIQSYQFAAYDMLLYLDTHPEDKKAFALFRELTKKANELKESYQEKYGPITASDVNSDQEWTWINEPWPWTV